MPGAPGPVGPGAGPVGPGPVCEAKTSATTRHDTARRRTIAVVRSLTMAQRVVLVVALGAALFFVGAYLTGGTHIASGWTGYAPLQSLQRVPVVSRAGLSGVGSLLLWLVLVAAWAAGSVAMLRPTGRRPAAEVDDDNAVRETGAR